MLYKELDERVDYWYRIANIPPGNLPRGSIVERMAARPIDLTPDRSYLTVQSQMMWRVLYGYTEFPIPLFRIRTYQEERMHENTQPLRS